MYPPASYPPSPSPLPGAPTGSGIVRIRPIRGLAIAVVVMLGVTTLTDLAALVITIDRAVLLSALIDAPDTVDLGAADLNDLLYTASSIPQMATFATTALLFILWLFRARANAEAMTPMRHHRPAAWIVFGWIVPVVNLVFPQQIVADIWTASHRGANGQPLAAHLAHPAPRSAWLVRAWWLSWLISMVLSTLAYRVADGEDLHAYLLTAQIEIVFALPTVICAVLAAMIVWKITTVQEPSSAAVATAG
ncbi:DUF4328 domain-containing protein [Planobispora takensis]|uniref:DUF4328 domain-containing protein n=1 Tax=Planobispora takensis TaxID=1367882 RepID=A0A8J3WWM5_9ACTN|nr:DUF4328 domain-containing protein [Planobispora takensis]GII05006.1 hypothetical protein Pta02_70140 [Planobispora takensis]